MIDPIQAAIFDLGGVIMDVSVERTVRAWAASTGLAVKEVGRRVADLSHYVRFERGEMTEDEFHRVTCRLLGCDLAREEFERGFNALLGRPLPGAEAVLADLAPHMRLVALTNTNAIHSRVWEPACAGALRHFERVFKSHEMGCRKPEPAAYLRVLEYLAVAPGRVVYFDDVDENVSAAAALGLVARCVKGPAEVARELAALGIPVAL
jgi:epoxide hydrolase-like predicted phosphatase